MIVINLDLLMLLKHLRCWQTHTEYSIQTITHRKRMQTLFSKHVMWTIMGESHKKIYKIFVFVILQGQLQEFHTNSMRMQILEDTDLYDSSIKSHKIIFMRLLILCWLLAAFIKANIFIYYSSSFFSIDQFSVADAARKRLFSPFSEELLYQQIYSQSSKRGAEIIDARKLFEYSQRWKYSYPLYEKLVPRALSRLGFLWILDEMETNMKDLNESIFFPVRVANQNWRAVNRFNISLDQRIRMNKTVRELLDERKAIQHLLKV